LAESKNKFPQFVDVQNHTTIAIDSANVHSLLAAAHGLPKLAECEKLRFLNYLG
jgi:hypothetical protein